MNISDFTLVNLIAWLIFGLITGLIAHLIDPGDVKGGILGTLLIGILGSLIGGFLANLFFGLGVTGFNIQSFIISVAGALLLVLLQRVLMRDNGHIKTKVTKMEGDS